MPDGGKRTDLNPGVIARTAQAARNFISAVNPAAWFGPLQPLKPMAPPEVKGRRFDYPTGYNLDSRKRGYEPVSFDQLRALADNCDILNLVIEKRKDQMEALPWGIRPKRQLGDKKQVAVTNAQQKRIDNITAFLESPDKEVGFPEWQRQILDDKFIIDQVAIYRRRDRAGRLYALEVIDGALIKPLLNDDGRRPVPPDPAYQEILHGIPGVDYTSDELAVFMHNPRSWKVYGRSEVEQILITVNTAIRRSLSQLEYYTAGSQPDAFMAAPKEWNLEQVKQFQEWFDSAITNTGVRRKLRFVPGDMKYQETKLPPQKDMWDEWLARIVCFAFSIPPEPFIQTHSRAGAESSKDKAAEEGLVPLQQWFSGIVNRLIIPEFNSPDLEFAYLDDRETDPLVASQIDESDGTSGFLTIDEIREKRGLDPYGGAAATLMVKTATGYVPIDAFEEQQATAQANAEASAAALAAGGKNETQDGKPNGKQPANGKKPSKTAAKSAGEHMHFQISAFDADAVKKLLGEQNIQAKLGKAVRHEPVPFPNPTSEKAVARLTSRLTVILKRAGHQSAWEAFAALQHLGKAAGDDEEGDTPKPESPADAAIAADQVAMAVTLEALGDVPGAVEGDLAMVAKRAGGAALAQVGTDTNDGIVGVVNDAAVDYARTRSAEMIGKRYNEDGDLIDNPDAEMAITDTTRDMIRKIIADGLEQGSGRKEIAEQIETSAAFSSDRAGIIARTEVADANSMSALAAYQASEAAGMKIMKEWYPDDEACPICLENADEGPIPLEDEFPSGDLAPTAHPNACFSGFSFAPYGGLRQILAARYDGPAITLEIEIIEESIQDPSLNTGSTPDLAPGNILSEKINRNSGTLGTDGCDGAKRIGLTIGPNHPVLTGRGFVKASELNQGDELLYDLRTENLGGSGVEANLKKMPLFEDAFNALRIAFGTVSIAAPSSYFHGDEVFTYGEVEVVRPERDLLPVLDLGGVEQCDEFSLVRADTATSPESRRSDLGAVLKGMFLPTDSGVSGGGHGLPSIGGLSCPPFFKRARIVASHKTTFSEIAYDASTEHTIYNCGGIVVANCECVLIPVVENPD